MPGGSKQQTTSTQSEPWKAAQPALQLGLKDAQSLYKKGVGGQIFTGSTVIPWDKQTKAGMGAIQRGANANIGGNGLSGEYQDVINSGGYNEAQLGALQNTQATANSNFDINSNPAFMQVLKQTQDAASNGVNASAAGAGRYGSGTHQQTLGNTLGDVTARAVGTEYGNWQGRKDAANTNAFNMASTGFGQLGAAYQGLQTPANDLMKIGSMNEDLKTRQMNDRLRIFNSKQNNPWEQLGRLNAIASGTGQMGGTQTQSQPGQNPWLQGLGYATGGAGLLGSFL